MTELKLNLNGKVKQDCQYFEEQTEGCTIFGTPDCKNCKNYIKKVD